MIIKNELVNRQVKIYITCNKGNKKGISHFVKYLTYWSMQEGHVKKALLNLNASAGTSEACAKAVDHSLQKIDSPAPKEKKKMERSVYRCQWLRDRCKHEKGT